MNKKIFKNLLAGLTVVSVGLLAQTASAQGFGTAEVNAGLGGSLSSADPREIIGRIINIALGFLGVVAVGFIAYAGFLWMTSNGEEERVSKAKMIMRNGVIGLVIILASWGIATFVISRLSDATGGGSGSGGCLTGEVSSCGCGGSMSCTDGSWGGCVGSDCSGTGGIGKPSSCDSSALVSGCQAADQICAEGDYCDNTTCACKTQGESGSSCNTNADGGVCSPDSSRCAPYLSCDATTCTCFGPPVVTGLSPIGGFCEDNINKSCTEDTDCGTVCNKSAANGAANNFLTISGKNFGEYSAASSRVVFSGNADGVSPTTINPGCVDSWTDTQIVIAVPAGASSGPITVVSGNGTVDTTANDYGPHLADFQANNIVRPGLCELTPQIGTLSAAVEYQGINLYAGEAYFGNYQTNVLSLSSNFSDQKGLAGTAAIPNIRSGASGSFVQASIGGNIQNSNYLQFTKQPEPGEGPFISSFYPASGNAGQYVTIRGNGFGGARGSAHVYFGETEATYDFPDVCLSSVWKNNQIIVKVPAGLTGGDYAIKIVLASGESLGTEKLNPNVFRFDANAVMAPSLCKIDPTNGPAATPVSLWGEYFGREKDQGLVKFSTDKSATGTIAFDGKAHLIKTTVPVGAITGPVKVVDDNVSGNELNFAVGECTADADCGTQICCPASTYKKGRCVNVLNDCLAAAPTSVFEWNFSTGLGDGQTNPFAYSCLGLARYFGACQTGNSCPNLPGSCSPAAAVQKIVGECDLSCNTVPGCASGACAYDATLDKCVAAGSAKCDLNKSFAYTLNKENLKTEAVCNANGKWEINLSSSCPSGWTRGSGNVCVDLGSTCAVCATGLSCESVNGSGACVSTELCSAAATCSDNPAAGEKDRCVVSETSTCACCCTIGQDAQDCCAYTSPTTNITTQLKCEGTCGSDTSTTDGNGGANSGLGKCGGCKSAGSTPAERDAACNCSGHSGQFCNINDPSFPDGVCTDCSNLSGSGCADHGNSCCLDAKMTSGGEPVCRGGNGFLISADIASPGYGYCAYYNCSTSNPTECAASNPVKNGTYPSQTKCTEDCPKSDPCPGLSQTACSANSRCCFDSNNTPDTADDTCRSGEKINTGVDAGTGYCAYYNCLESDPSKCATSTPLRIGARKSIAGCENFCANPPTGQGLSCAGVKAATCAFDKCNASGFSCLTATGNLGATADCGACCCTPGTVDSDNPKLTCLANKGTACTGTKRGLFCGCASDEECGSTDTDGCGLDTCCDSRPKINSSSPAHLAGNVCRNTSIQVDFNKPMDISSFEGNVLLLEEREYGSGVCPSGTFITWNDQVPDLRAPANRSWLARTYQKMTVSIARLVKRFGVSLNNSALADLPDASKLYCTVPGVASGDNNGETSALTFTPQRLLSAGTNYYLVLIGDKDLNSQSGLLSRAGIGLNGKGYFDQSANGGTGAYVLSENIKFNNKSFFNSQIIKFSTLAEQGGSTGVCAVDHVTVSPSSYLFKTTDNSLASEEDDTNAKSKSFDTKADRDKVFTARAYSDDGQILHPTTGYFWNWDFEIADSSVAYEFTPVPTDLAANRIMIAAKSGVTDSETKVTAKIDMSRFLATAGCASGACSCTDEKCSANCCNASSGGDGFNAAADLYVFLCNNPWPPVASDGTWLPWKDVANNCVGGGACAGYNYKFYYCRDAGAADTNDDLPAILDQAVARGASESNKVCSADRTACANLGSACGPDKNGDGQGDGICIWNILKESYFFREALLEGGEITTATDAGTGGSVSLTWTSAADQVAAYKIYYLKSNKGTMLSREFKPTDTESGQTICSLNSAGTIYTCRAAITGLENGAPYIFKVSVVSVKNTESTLSAEMTATPTDTTPADAPDGLTATIKDNKLVVSWKSSGGEADFYRLSHGVYAGKYAESFDSEPQATKIALEPDKFNVGDHYLAVSSIDKNGNESAKSAEINFAVTSCATKDKPKCKNFNFFENILTNVDFEKLSSNGLPADWSVSYQEHSLVSTSQADHLSGKQSVLMHQDTGQPYPGTCSQQFCQTSGICTWDSSTNTCRFWGIDYCHSGAASYANGEELCWPNTNRVMWMRLAYSLANLDFKVGDQYAVSFYYKGKAAAGANVGIASALDWPSYCVDYGYPNALKSKFSYASGIVTPTPAPGEDPCSGSYGPSCSEQPNYCCAQAPYQKKCYGSNYLPSIASGEHPKWTWYYYPFQYSAENASWLDSAGRKIIEVGISMGYNSTGDSGTDLYIDDFIVKRISVVNEVN